MENTVDQEGGKTKKTQKTRTNKKALDEEFAYFSGKLAATESANTKAASLQTYFPKGGE